VLNRESDGREFETGVGGGSDRRDRSSSMKGRGRTRGAERKDEKGIAGTSRAARAGFARKSEPGTQLAVELSRSKVEGVQVMRLCCSDTPLWDLVGQLPLVILITLNRWAGLKRPRPAGIVSGDAVAGAVQNTSVLG
jgi:hypothetical protein